MGRGYLTGIGYEGCVGLQQQGRNVYEHMVVLLVVRALAAAFAGSAACHCSGLRGCAATKAGDAAFLDLC